MDFTLRFGVRLTSEDREAIKTQTGIVHLDEVAELLQFFNEEWIASQREKQEIADNGGKAVKVP